MSKRTTWLGWIGGAFLLCAAPAPVRAAGTHFMVEPYSGIVFPHGSGSGGEPSFESGALLAVDGKWRGLPPRFYLYFKAAQAFQGQESLMVGDGDSPGHVERAYSQLTGGLRVVFSLVGALRLNVECGGGTLFSSSHFEDRESGLLDIDEEIPVVEGGAGLSLRLFRFLSVGAMFHYRQSLAGEGRETAWALLDSGASGSSPSGWSRITANLALHF